MEVTMKEIKAYVKLSELERVVSGLKQAGFCCMSIIDVAGLGNYRDPENWKYSMEFVEKMSKVAKIELVCPDRDAEKAVEAIRINGCTHQAGDGIVFVYPVERAVKIRSGDEGERILQTPSKVE
jgi:nitrogen regulatory protein P-II 1